MPEFLTDFPRVAAAGAGFCKNLLTPTVELGFFLIVLCAGCTADRLSHESTIMFAVIIFVFRSALQTAAADCAMLTVARQIVEWGIGMLSTVTRTCISELSLHDV